MQKIAQFWSNTCLETKLNLTYFFKEDQSGRLMLRNKYIFTTETSCCNGPTEDPPKCPGLCGIFTWSKQKFKVQSSDTVQNANVSSGLLGFISDAVMNAVSKTNRLNQVNDIPYFCCNYITCCAWEHTQLLLHDNYNIKAPIRRCPKTFLISNGNTHIGMINDIGFCCFRTFYVINDQGEHVMTTIKEYGQIVGINNEGKKVAAYNLSKSCCGGLTIQVELFTDNQVAKMLSLALVSYL